MFGARKATKRFSLLLLEEGEDYVDDWVAEAKWPASVSGNWQSLPKLPGRLRLCSKSIFFEPDDVRIPIVRLPLSQVQRMEPEGSQAFAMASQLVVKMRANMMDAPYIFNKGSLSNWHFSLTYAQLSAFMPVAHQYLAASRLPYSERDDALRALSQKRMEAAAFDTSRLVDFMERVQYSGVASQLTPLVCESGRLVITNQRLYFQPLHNVTGDSPVRVHALADVAAVARRRSSLKPTGLELFFIDAGSSSGPSVFFAFGTELERDNAAAVIAEQPSVGANLPGGREAAAACGSILEAEGGWLQRVTAAWQHGKISNLDYLLFCNFAAGRSFNDLTQWPVFPWVLADYSSSRLDLGSPASFRDLSKPVGALNAARLEVFRERYWDMPRGEGMDAPFMYGSHYSCPGYVMFWMVRAAPGHLLRLQGGRFDAADRLFCSIKEAWDSVTSSTADVKELIPEFFLSDPSFLVNADHLALGTRQNGRPVNDVELPPWAHSPQLFLELHRAALESPYVSANLHHWINLIFGYKQQGEAAVEADNVFHHLTYGSSREAGPPLSRQERAALEVQINEFGQCPRQIFHAPHAPRLVCPSGHTPSDQERGNAVGLGSPSKFGRMSGAEVSSELSLALLATIREAVASPSPQLDQSIQVPETLAKLDVLARKAREAEQPLIDATGSAALNSLQDEIPGAEDRGNGTAEKQPSRRSTPSRLRDWSGKLGSQIHSLRDTLSPGTDSVASVTTTLRGLFQRQGSTSSTAIVAPPQPSVYSGNGKTAKGATPVGNGGMHGGAAETGIASALVQAAGGPSSEAGSRPTSPLPAGSQRASAAAATSAASAPGSRSSSPGRVSGSPVAAEVEADSARSSPQPQQGASSGGGPERPLPSAAAQDDAAGSLPFDDSGFREAVLPSSRSRARAAAGPGRAAGQLWPQGFREMLPDKPTISVMAQQGAVHAAAAAQTPDGPMLFCVGQTGTLKTYSQDTGAQVRAVKLASVPCGSLALLERDVAKHPIVLAGCYNNMVYASQHGRPLGSFPAHDDAVSCLLAPAAADAIITGSWDCSVKTWCLADGRAPWGGQPVLPNVEVSEHESGVWAMASDEWGQFVLTGTEEGCVAAWDLRSRQIVWQASISEDYIGGLCLTPNGSQAVVAAGDGVASLLDIRMAGRRLTFAACGSPLRCAACDGHLALLGSECGEVAFWNPLHPVGPRSLTTCPGPDGLYRPLTAGSAAVNSIAVTASSLVTGDEDGCLHVFNLNVALQETQ